VKLCVAGCKEAAAACKETSASAGDAASAACASDPATERVCLGAAKRVTKESRKSCKGAQKACKRCCKDGGKACVLAPELPLASGSFPAPDRSELERLSLPPAEGRSGFLLMRLPGGELVLDPTARTPVSAAAECATAVLACFDLDLRNFSGCFAAVPACKGPAPWKGDGPMCCAAACGERYQAELRLGRSPPEAFTAAIWEAPSCMPGMARHPLGGAP
jgi:hypothetical protein